MLLKLKRWAFGAPTADHLEALLDRLTSNGSGQSIRVGIVGPGWGQALVARDAGQVAVDQSSATVPLLCLTKPVVAALAASLVEVGRFDWDVPVAVWAPELTAEGWSAVTAFDLLTHATTFPFDQPPIKLDGIASDSTIAESLNAVPMPQPDRLGLVANYSVSWAWELLRLVLERSQGVSIGTLVHQYVAEPLGLSSLSLVVESADSRWLSMDPILAKVGALLRPSRSLAPANLMRWPGSFGALATPLDYASFLNAISDSAIGESDFLTQSMALKLITAQRRNRVDSVTGDVAWGVGFAVEHRNAFSGLYKFGGGLSEATFGHFGLWNLASFCDPLRGVSCCAFFDTPVEGQDHFARCFDLARAVATDFEPI